MQKISQDQILQRARQENPWWSQPHALPELYAKWKPRPYLDLLAPLLVDSSVLRAVVLMGPRRVGKTVMIHHMIGRLLDSGMHPSHICYFSVDHPIYSALSLDEFVRIYGESASVDTSHEECYVFFDEIQYLRDWEKHLKSLTDSYPNLRLLASGSAAAALRLKSAESGAGRFTDFLLPPLTFHEYLSLIEQTGLVQVDESTFPPTHRVEDITSLNSHFVNYLNFGGYPEVVFSEEIQADPGRFIKSDIIDKVLLRDLPQLYGIQDIQELNYLFTNLAFNTASEVSLEELSKGSGVAKNTIKKYIEYLEAAFLIKTVHRIDQSAKRFKRANFFKVYLTNPSMRAALFSPVSIDDPAMGALVETAIFSQWFHSEQLLHYARWKDGEVDIVLLDRNMKPLVAAEVKWSDRFFDHPEELASLSKFCHHHALVRALVTSRTKNGNKTVRETEYQFRPASLHCHTLGYNIVRTKQVGHVELE